MSHNVIIIGAGGHAKVIADIVLKNNDTLMGFLDDNKPKNEIILGYPVLGKLDDIVFFDDKAVFIIGIGNNAVRKSLSEKYNVTWHTAIHPSASIGIDVTIGDGTVIMANAVINPSAKIGRHCIINTGAIVEHDNVISDYVHISPNASLGGTVKVGECTHIGIGASVKNNITITNDCVIGAAAVVVKDVVSKGVYVGVPARRIK
ncbi:MAG: acetyltransferase [Oscillospiraceae bacterium]|nr:acetyltransferase [Oscillospiraceae bacterium]